MVFLTGIRLFLAKHPPSSPPPQLLPDMSFSVIGRIPVMTAIARRCNNGSLVAGSSSISILAIHSISNHLQQPFRPSFFQQQQRRTMLAGHNKWSKIRHKKGAKDVKRANLLGKASRSVTAASRECNGDVTHMRLQAAIAQAKAVQLPKDRLEEAIQKGTVEYRSKQKGSGSGGELENLRFDAMMRITAANSDESSSLTPGDSDSSSSSSSSSSQQVACIITALSDNRNRTTQQIRHLVTKTGGELLPTDSLNYLFHQVGIILVEQTKASQDNMKVEDFEEMLLDAALEAGAINVEELPPQEDDDDDDEEEEEPGTMEENLHTFVVTTEERDLWQVVQSLKESGYQVTQFQHRYVLLDEELGGVELSAETCKAFDDFVDKLEDLEDVNHVYHNAN